MNPKANPESKCHSTVTPMIIFTDGAASGNPGPGGWGAVILFDDPTPGGWVKEIGGGASHSTNNRMELMAAISALELLKDREGAVEVHADSEYVIKGITEWIEGWLRRGWHNSQGKTVMNRDLWERLLELTRARTHNKQRLTWKHVRAHNGHPINERADEIAVAFSLGNKIELFDGRKDQYRYCVVEQED